MKTIIAISKFIPVILVILLTSLSLTSCEFDFEFSFDEYIPGYEQGEENAEQNQAPDGAESENWGSFYPGSGQADINEATGLSRALLSTVTISCEGGFSYSMGSGVILSLDKENGDAYIITNQHVIHNATSIKVYLYGMHHSAYAIPATLVGGSITYDLAVLKIKDSQVIRNGYACAVDFADSDDLRVFDRVYAVGNSEGGGTSATEGIVSVDSETISVIGAGSNLISLRVIRMDAAVNSGNSGGGLYDEQGRLVGIVSAKEMSEDIDNMGYAIPSSLVKNVVNSILHYCDGNSTSFEKALLGVVISSYVGSSEIDDNGKIYKLELVEVTEVIENSLAYGKIKVGDVIKSITVDGVKKEVTRLHHVTDMMLTAREGSTVQLCLIRDGSEINLTLTVRESDMSLVK